MDFVIAANDRVERKESEKINKNLDAESDDTNWMAPEDLEKKMEEPETRKRIVTF